MDRRDIEHQAPHFAQELPPAVFKTIRVAIEIPQVDYRHLRETAGQKCDRTALLRTRPKEQPGTGFRRRGIGALYQRFVADGAGETETAEEIVIFGRPRR